MRILVDTNICLDILQKRSDFYDTSKNALFLASKLPGLSGTGRRPDNLVEKIPQKKR